MNRFEKLLDHLAIDSHERTLFLARDSVSGKIARELFPHLDVRLYPDVVTTLIGSYCFGGKREGILLCARDDFEKLYDYDEIEALADELAGLEVLDRTDTTVDLSDADIVSMDSCLSGAWKRLEEVIATYARYRVVVTDRFHGTIFARIAGTPVVVLRITDHKVIAGSKWFTDAGDEAICVANNLDEVPQLVKSLMRSFPEGKQAPEFGAPSLTRFAMPLRACEAKRVMVNREG